MADSNEPYIKISWMRGLKSNNSFRKITRANTCGSVVQESVKKFSYLRKNKTRENEKNQSLSKNFLWFRNVHYVFFSAKLAICLRTFFAILFAQVMIPIRDVERNKSKRKEKARDTIDYITNRQPRSSVLATHHSSLTCPISHLNVIFFLWKEWVDVVSWTDYRQFTGVRKHLHVHKAITL